jgi:hypothetical protein
VKRIEASVRTLCGATGGASSAQSKSSNVSSGKRGSTNLVKQRSVDSQASPSSSSSPEYQQLVVFTTASTNRSAEPEPVSPQIPDCPLVPKEPIAREEPAPIAPAPEVIQEEPRLQTEAEPEFHGSLYI